MFFVLTCIVVQWVVELNDWSRVQHIRLKQISLHDIFLIDWMSMLFVFKVFNLKPFLLSHSQVETGLE